jgi:hypothetical protein
MKTKLPAIQAEQVEDDVAPVTTEYVPAKASHEEFSKAVTSEGEKMGAGTRFSQ